MSGRRPDLAFAFSHPAHALALFGGSGCIHPAPGTWGTAAGILVYWLLSPWISPLAWLAACAAMFLAGWAAAARTGRDLGEVDSGSIVIDEVVAVWLVAAAIPQGPWWCLAAFAAFRLFDIFKVWPASAIDRATTTAFGVMVDDIAAAGHAIALIWICIWGYQWIC